MDLSKELERFAEGLQQQRDELKVQMHLAGMEAKREWENSEAEWKQFRNKLKDIADETVDTGEEFLAATKVIGEELKSTYERIRNRLRE